MQALDQPLVQWSLRIQPCGRVRRRGPTSVARWRNRRRRPPRYPPPATTRRGGIPRILRRRSQVPTPGEAYTDGCRLRRKCIPVRFWESPSCSKTSPHPSGPDNYIHRQKEIHTQIGSKTIGLREETYDCLERATGDDESFSDVIDRLLGTDDPPLEGIVGLLSDEEAARLHEHSRAFRAEADERLARDR